MTTTTTDTATTDTATTTTTDATTSTDTTTTTDLATTLRALFQVYAGATHIAYTAIQARTDDILTALLLYTASSIKQRSTEPEDIEKCITYLRTAIEKQDDTTDTTFTEDTATTTDTTTTT